MDIRGVHVTMKLKLLSAISLPCQQDPSRHLSPPFNSQLAAIRCGCVLAIVGGKFSRTRPTPSPHTRPNTCQKSRMFPLFWPAYDVSFTSSNILKAFEATGISPANAEVILKRFTSTPSGQDEDLEFAQHGDGSSLNELRKLFEVAVKDTAGDDAKRLGTSLHSLQVQNELLNYENQGLRTALVTKRKNRRTRLLEQPHNRASKNLTRSVVQWVVQWVVQVGLQLNRRSPNLHPG
jgi:hypothetical protein